MGLLWEIIMRVSLFVMGAIMASPVMAQTTVTPGQYQVVSVIESMSMPNMPPEMMKMMQGKSTTMKICITEEDTKRDPKKMMGADKNCQVKRMDISAGKMDAEMSCKTEQGPMTMVMSGSYTPTGYEIKSEMRGAMNVKSRMSAKRIGACK